jgi:hypothetical protein
MSLLSGMENGALVKEGGDQSTIVYGRSGRSGRSTEYTHLLGSPGGLLETDRPSKVSKVSVRKAAAYLVAFCMLRHL